MISIYKTKYYLFIYVDSRIEKKNKEGYTQKCPQSQSLSSVSADSFYFVDLSKLYIIYV